MSLNCETLSRALEKAERVECIGGWSFLLLALGVFCLLPGTILTGIYIRESISDFRVVALALFCASLVLVIVGITLCVYWSIKSSPRGDVDTEKQSATKSSTRNEVTHKMRNGDIQHNKTCESDDAQLTLTLTATETDCTSATVQETNYS